MKAIDITLTVLSTVAEFVGTTDVPAQQVQTLLVVGNTSGPLSMEDIQKRVGVGQSSISRHCSRLGPGLTPRDPGWGLVEAYEDPEYRRRKLVQLTPRGKVLIQEIAKATERMVR